MRRYKARIVIPENLLDKSTGWLGERIFQTWFNMNYEGEQLFKQKKDRDYEKIDFSCDKGYKYQVKATRNRSYTFNCNVDDILDNLECDYYVFVQIKNNIAYIEDIYIRQYVIENIRKSYSDNNCFVYSTDLMQEEVLL